MSMDKFYFTDAGLEYIAKTADGKVLCFTKGKFGSGTPSGDIADMTDLDSPLGELQITNKDVDDNKVTVRTVFSNVEDGAVMQGFRLKELGLFAKLQDPGGTDALGYPETLIAYACVSDGDSGDLIAGSPTDYVISWPFVISNADNVEVLVDQSAYALHSDVSELMETKADRQTATGGFTAGRNAEVATVAGTAIEYMYIGQWKNGQKLSYVSGAPEGLYDKNNTTPPVNSAAQIFNVFDLGAERNISAVTLYVADGGASLTNMVCLTNDLTGGRSNYIDVLRTNGEVQNGVPVIENKLSSDGYIKVGHTDGGYIGKYRYVLVYDWSNVCKASELYVETDTAETPIPAIQLGEGTNAKAYTMQVYGHQLLDEDGHIPEERLLGDDLLGQILKVSNEPKVLMYEENTHTENDVTYVKKAVVFQNGEFHIVENQDIGLTEMDIDNEYVIKLAFVGTQDKGFHFYIEGQDDYKPQGAIWEEWTFYTESYNEEQEMLIPTIVYNKSLQFSPPKNILGCFIKSLIKQLETN